MPILLLSSLTMRNAICGWMMPDMSLMPIESQPICSNSTPIFTKFSTVWTGLIV
jgi:hypothetical protein